MLSFLFCGDSSVNCVNFISFIILFYYIRGDGGVGVSVKETSLTFPSLCPAFSNFHLLLFTVSRFPFLHFQFLDALPLRSSIMRSIKLSTNL